MSAITDAQNLSIENALGRTTQYLASVNDVTGTGIVETLVSATAFQVSPTRSADMYVTIVTAAALAVQISPDNVTFITLMASETAGLGMFHINLPAGWYIKLTGTMANLAVTAILK